MSLVLLNCSRSNKCYKCLNMHNEEVPQIHVGGAGLGSHEIMATIKYAFSKDLSKCTALYGEA